MFLVSAKHIPLRMSVSPGVRAIASSEPVLSWPLQLLHRDGNLDLFLRCFFRTTVS